MLQPTTKETLEILAKDVYVSPSTRMIDLDLGIVDPRNMVYTRYTMGIKGHVIEELTKLALRYREWVGIGYNILEQRVINAVDHSLYLNRVRRKKSSTGNSTSLIRVFSDTIAELKFHIRIPNERKKDYITSKETLEIILKQMASDGYVAIGKYGEFNYIVVLPTQKLAEVIRLSPGI